MSVRVVVDVAGLDKMVSALSPAGRRVLLRNIGQEMVVSSKARFRTETDPLGNRWPQSKAARRRGGKTLTQSGRLRDSIISQIAGRSVQIGTNIVYARAHQLGLPARELRPKRKKALYWPGARHPVKKVNLPALPARPFMGISQQDQKLIQAAVVRHLSRK